MDITTRVRAMYSEHPFPPPCRRGTYGAQAELLRALLDEHRGSVDGAQILDAGCGTGAMAVDFAKAMPGASVLGVDLTPASIAVARKYANEEGVRNVQFAVGDILRSPFESSFDLVHSWGVIHHTSNPEDAFHALASALAPGGILRVGVYGRNGNHLRRVQRRMLGSVTHGMESDDAVSVARAWATGDATVRESNTEPPVDLASDAWIRDEYLHAHEQHLPLAGLAEWCKEEGLTILGLTDYHCRPISLDITDHNSSREFCRAVNNLKYEPDRLAVIDAIARPYWLGLVAKKGAS